MRRLWAMAIPLVLALCAPGALGEAGLTSKKFRFKTNVLLQVGETTPDGVRLDTVLFTLPATVGGAYMRTGGLARADVAVSNNAESAQKVGIALALFDDEGRLVGVASGGSKLAALKPDRQKTFELVFDDVNSELFRATTFQVSIEAR